MIELGTYQTLEVVKKTDFGFYLSEIGSDKQIKLLLPIKESPADTKLGDHIRVFVYKDSEDREITTTKEMPVTIGGIAQLTVKDVSNVGAFLDWGLMKDLLLPYKEQTKKVSVGDKVLVTLYVDKSKRLCATMKVYDLLSTDAPYEKDDLVEGFVYESIEAFGIFVAVDLKYSGMIPKNEIFSNVKVGDTVKARIIDVRPDGKLTLSLRDKSYKQIDQDSELILSKLTAAGGFLPYHDNSDPEAIKLEFTLSKNAFKRAVGKLYKAGTIIITEKGIQLK